MKHYWWIGVIAAAVALEALTAPGAGLLGPGWRLSRSGAPGMAHFTITRSQPGGRWSTSSDVPLSNFRGLSLNMLGQSGPAKFEYVQDAGRILCEGKFSWGVGSGSFTVAANPEYVAELNRLGFASPNQDELFSLMMSDVKLDFARAVQEAGAAGSLSQLVDLRNHGVTLQYIRDLRRAGYQHFRLQDYIDLRNHGVNAQFAAELQQAGYDLSARQIIDLSTHGVDSGFVRDLKFYGLHPRDTEIVQLRSHGVTPQYLRGLKDAGYSSLSADQVVNLRAHGVASDFALQARDLGYRFSAQELIDLRTHGVDARYLKTVHDSGMQNLSAPQITQLRAHGIN